MQTLPGSVSELNPALAAQLRPCLKKPIPVHAVQIQEPFRIDTLDTLSEEYQYGQAGDYLMQGTQGELYICPKAAYEASYDFC